MRRSKGALAFWGGAVFGGLGYLDYWLSRNHPEYTLSETGRTWFNCQHPVGEAAFLLFWGRLTLWFIPHIVKPARAARASRAVAAVSGSLAAPKE